MSNGDGLPKGWVTTTVNDLAASIQYGHTASATDDLKGPRFLRITDIQHNRVDWASVPSCDISSEDVDKYRLQAGDIVFARTGATTGKSYLIRECPEAVFASYLIRLRMRDNAFPQYVQSFFHTNDYWRQIEGGKRGIGQPNVNASVLGTIRLPLAPVNEQRRIVAKIGELFSDLDAGVAALERVKAKLKRYRAAVLKAAVEGKLTEEWRKKNRPKETGRQLLDRILQERRQEWEEEQLAAYEKAGKKPPVGWKDKYKEPAAPDKSSLPGLPEGWCWASLGQLRSESLNGYGNRRGEVGEPTIVLRLADIENGLMSLDAPRRINSKTESIQRYSLRSDDLLVIRVNGSPDLVGRFVRIDSTPETVLFCDHFIRVRLFEPLASRYVRLFADTAIARKHVESNKVCSAGQNTISQGSLDGLPIPLPPLKEQEVIVANVDQCLSNSGGVESQIAANLKRSARLRQSILKRAFEGKLAPQDPKDEPANRLLERIKAAKENGSPKTTKPARKTT